MAGFAGMLVVTMAVSTLAFFALAVVASELESEFDLSKLQLGLLGAANTGVGAVFGPTAGRLADRFGARAAMSGVLMISGITAAAIAAAQSYTLLLLAMGFAGLAQGLGNPATNKAISTGVEANQRGLLTGIKQSGVQLAVFTSGFAMPVISRNLDWRAGMWMTAALALAAMAGLFLITEIDEPSPTPEPDPPPNPIPASDSASLPTRRGEARLPIFVYQVTIYGFLLGVVGGGLGRFLPLFAEEAAGFSPEAAGQVFGISGLVAIPTRIVSGILLDRGVSAARTLVLMGSGGAIAIGLILGAAEGPGAFLWIGAVVSGMTLGSWNTAANLSMIRERRGAGRASGVLIAGFLLGLTVGGPAVGWSIDTFDSYYPAWITSAAMAALAAVIVSRRVERAHGYP